MEKFDVIFCVVTYKNYNDLTEFIDSLNNNNINFSYKIIVVNNFADEASLNSIKELCTSQNCDFIENENNGYSHGNNLGIEYAQLNYSFEYLIVCNPDTTIKQFDFNNLKGQEKKIIAPEIICLNGKRQNPMYYKYMPLSEKIVYLGYKNRKKHLLLLGLLFNKVTKFLHTFLFDKSKKNNKKIYACHGSYIIFSHYAIDRLFPVFDEGIFLFCEESDLAMKAKEKDIDIIFNKDIIVYHKEDGSMSLSSKNLNEIQRKSYLYYYEKWHKIIE
ncbi:glycosyltransferase family 2 protein [Caldifermentibacillus hisashii]|uniref:glycosyltransferase family 2 protein n=1 Tax=Caldifermentibacillus hisashii TaxID=996558 RepID=UPI003D1BF6FF